MKKKIEKIPDDKKYYEESEFVEEVIEKLNQIIDHLNSQVQPEEIDNTKLVMPPSAYDQAEKEGFNMKNKVKSKLLPQDTPEEWEKEFMEVLETFKDEICLNFFASSKPLTNFIKQLLSEREREVLNSMREWVVEYHKDNWDIRDFDAEIAIGKIIDRELSKLNKKK